ncbi:MAG TPA: phosphate ABC transporter, permease protein PstA, partial [Candidatus Peribacteria bacterium]|nr:phosphate ABC transporter, permease protein PstA [Candidatus Peribacteria bacterium]
MNNTMFEQRLFFALFRLSGVLGVGLLVIVLLGLLVAGHGALSWQFLSMPWQHSDITKGGIFPAIVGSVWLGVGVTLVSFPFGIGAAVYLTEYGKDTWLRRIVQLAFRNLAGVPSVFYGLFGLAAFVHMLNFGTT